MVCLYAMGQRSFVLVVLSLLQRQTRISRPSSWIHSYIHIGFGIHRATNRRTHSSSSYYHSGYGSDSIPFRCKQWVPIPWRLHMNPELPPNTMRALYYPYRDLGNTMAMQSIGYSQCLLYRPESNKTSTPSSRYYRLQAR